MTPAVEVGFGTVFKARHEDGEDPFVITGLDNVLPSVFHSKLIIRMDPLIISTLGGTTTPADMARILPTKLTLEQVVEGLRRDDPHLSERQINYLKINSQKTPRVITI